jgi:hypothetical protein
MSSKTSTRNSIFRVAITLLFSLALSGCVTSFHKGQHEQFENSLSQEGVKKVLLVPADIQIFELGVSETEEVPEWTAQGQQMVDKVLLHRFSDYSKFALTAELSLAPEDQELLDEYNELLYPVINAESTRIRNPAWNVEGSSTKTTLGPGLKFMKDRYGVDYIVFASGQDYISSKGRKAAAVVGAIFGVGIQMGFSYLSVGVVETETGNLLWNNLVFSQEVGFLEEDEVQKAVTASLQTFPALAAGGTELPAQEK